MEIFLNLVHNCFACDFVNSPWWFAKTIYFCGNRSYAGLTCAKENNLFVLNQGLEPRQRVFWEFLTENYCAKWTK